MKRFLVFSISIAALAGACRKNEGISSVVAEGPAPDAAFTNSSGSLVVNFTNQSKDGESYYWQFGDGSVSTEASPAHTYQVAGRYTVRLKARSAAGYTDTVSRQVIASAAAEANFGIGSTFGTHVIFTNLSTAVESVAWNFGDNTSSTDLHPDHEFPDFGSYTVTLTVTGLLGDVDVHTQVIDVVDNNLVKGGGFEAGDAGFWSNWASQNNNPPQFGYTGDRPKGSYGGVLRFPSFSASSGSNNQLIYQAVQVVAGKRYKLSAKIKTPSGGSQCYYQFYISNDANTWVENETSAANHFLSLNAWHGWGSLNNVAAVNGDVVDVASKSYGTGAATGGVYTASFTGTVYIGIQAGTWQGTSNGDWLLDNLSFTLLP